MQYSHKSLLASLYGLVVAVDKTVPAWQRAGFEVSVINIHDEQKHITTSFYCDNVPKANHTCKYSLERPIQSRQNTNPVARTHYNNIVYDAAKRKLPGLDVLNQTRLQAVDALAKYHEQTLGLSLNDLPLICPKRKLLHKVLNKSLKFEKLIMPQLYASPKGEAEHRRSFWYMADEKKEFCEVNTKILLENKESWHEVLDSMKQGNSRGSTIISGYK